MNVEIFNADNSRLNILEAFYATKFGRATLLEIQKESLAGEFEHVVNLLDVNSSMAELTCNALVALGYNLSLDRHNKLLTVSWYLSDWSRI